MAGVVNINVKTIKAQEGYVTVVWTNADGLGFQGYRVHAKPLIELASKARSILHDFGDVYRAPSPNFTNGIVQLAGIGRELREGLFTYYISADSAIARESLDWFNDVTATSPGVTITVAADPILPLPWGLLSEANDSTPSIQLYSQFWALRFQVATTYNAMRPGAYRTSNRDGGPKLISALDQVVFEKASGALHRSQADIITSFLNRPVGKAFSSKGCRIRWKEVGNENCVIYFYGHATGRELRFGESDALSALSFRNIFRRESRQLSSGDKLSYVLSILNGCATVTGQESDGFLEATSDFGCCGFIGAEAIVPDQFAILFGHELLHLLIVEGLTVRAAMTKLWHKHEPMALFYGCYAPPSISVSQPQPGELPPSFDSVNYHPGMAR